MNGRGSASLAVGQDSRHGPTLALLAALRENEWLARPPIDGNALLVHPTFGRIELEVDQDNTDRVHALIDGRQVPMRLAMQRAAGEI